MSSDPHEVTPMVNTYKKLFLVLSVITLVGIAVALLHLPWWIVLIVGLVFITIKSLIVYKTFENLLTGRNIIIITFILTGIFVIGLLLIPILNHNGYIVGTEDISKPLLMEQHDEEGEHHGH